MKKSTPFSLAEAMAKLEAIEASFRQPNLDLEASLVRHAEAKKIAEEIKHYLKTVEQTLEKLSLPYE